MKAVVKYPGSKWGIADWIIGHMPDHHTYLEPYLGSGAVLFKKRPSPIETVNDLDCNVVNLFRIIREQPEELARVIAATPFSRFEYDSTFEQPAPEEPIMQARWFLLQCWQGHGFRVNGYKVGWKNDVQGREKAYELSNWYRLPVWILEAAERLRKVQIENRPAIEVIKRHKYPNVLIYADPPYVLGTRTGKQYKCEMTDNDHREMLQALLDHPGPVILSGYENDVYNTILHGWHKESVNAQAGYRKPVVETIWMNRTPAQQLEMF
ncbi:DNA adenine methylase [Desulfitobacterium chlororespirans]|uniref:DNA adenine methylase n=1 Tax=Desulfitobacterium chlororespirans DSM 11544 TaxID=1121395 RepID=A0A1M7U379_9FIRM|nr:DNA adenine methylase [Desulfitobacterium chlororespirans]SHN77469.1 DNA adenine methylase [Desulfitobacterium chlororespirans DSM 11544]